MKREKVLGAAAFCVLCAVSAEARAELSANALATIQQMPWQAAQDVQLPASPAHLLKLPGFALLTGENAQRVATIEDPGTTSKIEAMAARADGAEVEYQYVPSGYVRADDWTRVDAANFIQQIRTNTQTSNPARVAAGMATLQVNGWIQAPAYNQDTRTVTWVFDGSDSAGTRFVNAVALKLGRTGFERIVYIDSATNVQQALPNLLVAADAHRFNNGFTYSDFNPSTDKVAAYGVAGLVAGILGVKLLNVAAGGALALAAKKFAFLLLLPLLWLRKKLFRGKPKAAQS